MLAKVSSLTHCGLDGHHVQIESDLSNSLPGLSVIGLVGKSVDEAKERIKSAIKNSQLNFPPKRVTLSLAPADLPKQGSQFDLALAVSILAASGQIPQPSSDWLFYGELSLDGNTRPTQGALSAAVYCSENDISRLFVSKANATAAAATGKVDIYPVTSLRELYLHLIGEKLITPFRKINRNLPTVIPANHIDLEDIYGQHSAKRALIISIAGNHNLLMTGSPGAGKSMLARAAHSLLPAPDKIEQIVTTRIHNLAGVCNEDIMATRPYRDPHHSISHIGLVGGGQFPRPGEISLAHNGILFLDEFAEFSRQSLETLRQPLEEGKITISRAQANTVFPANFLLIAAQNPCPCGYLNDENIVCTCPPGLVNRYQTKLSGPLLDRIDLKIWVKRLNIKDYKTNKPSVLTTSQAKQIIDNCRSIQSKRFRHSSHKTNAKMDNKAVKAYCNLDNDTNILFERAVSELHLSARSYMKILKVSRTIADMEGSDKIHSTHLSEALQYR